MGSEFAYEDMSSADIEKYQYLWLRDDTVDGRAAWVVEQYPQYEKSGYTRRIVWLDKERYIPVKTEFYDRKNALLKTLSYQGYRQYLDKHWRPDRMEMQNVQTGKSTVLEYSEYEFNSGLDSRDFDRNALQRAR